jgi:hypothetical protein
VTTAGSTEIARARQVALYEHRDNGDGIIFGLEDADAIFRWEGLRDLAAAIKNAEHADAFITARGVARCLSHVALAVGETQWSIIHRFKLEPDALERQVRRPSAGTGVLLQFGSDVPMLAQMAADEILKLPFVQRLLKEMVLDGLSRKAAQSGEEGERIRHVLGRDERPLPQHVAYL